MAISKLIPRLKDLKLLTIFGWGLILFVLMNSSLLYLSIDDIPYYYFDEPYYVNATKTLFSPDKITNWEHPPLGKYFILLGRTIFSDKVFGSRFFSFIFFTFTLFGLAKSSKILDDSKESQLYFLVFPSFLASIDPLFVNFSKIAMLDGYVIFFQVLLICLTLTFIKNSKITVKRLLIFSIVSGLGLSCKWTLIPVFVVSTGLVVVQSRSNLNELVKIFTIVPLVTTGVYLVTFLPYLLTDNQGASFSAIIQLQKQMLDYHREFTGNPFHSSLWWTWPLAIKPLWLKFSVHHSTIQGIFAVGNIIVHLGFLVLIGFKLLFRQSWSNSSIYLLICYLSMICMWGLSGREVQFYHYYLATTPVIYLLSTTIIFSSKVPFKSVIGIGVGVLGFIFYLIYSPFVFYRLVSLDYFENTMLIEQWKYVLFEK